MTTLQLICGVLIGTLGLVLAHALFPINLIFSFIGGGLIGNAVARMTYR